MTDKSLIKKVRNIVAPYPFTQCKQSPIQFGLPAENCYSPLAAQWKARFYMACEIFVTWKQCQAAQVDGMPTCVFGNPHEVPVTYSNTGIYGVAWFGGTAYPTSRLLSDEMYKEYNEKGDYFTCDLSQVDDYKAWEALQELKAKLQEVQKFQILQAHGDEYALNTAMCTCAYYFVLVGITGDCNQYQLSYSLNGETVKIENPTIGDFDAATELLCDYAKAKHCEG